MAMELSRLLLCLLVAVSVLAAPSAADVPVASKPGCPIARCGDIDVPYPFGLERRCAISKQFHLNCKTIAGGTKLFHGKFEVMNISVQENKAWLKTKISWQCYNGSTSNNGIYMGTNKISKKAIMNITSMPYVLSRDDNKVFVLGCNDVVPFIMVSDNTYILGCRPTCDRISPTNGTCSGAGCCHVDLPNGVQYTRGLFAGISNKTTRNYPCNYITVMQNTAFNFNTAYLTSTVFNDTYEAQAPAVMEWAISRNTTCEQAKIDKTTPYACVSDNSYCSTNDAGYVCKCSNGYKGNPYVDNGCADINECEEPEAYLCYGECHNVPGNFQCHCRGTYGNYSTKGGCKDSFIGLSIMLGVGGSTILLILALVGPFVMHKIKIRKMKQKYFKQNHGLLLQQLISRNANISERMIISLRELEKATNNFDKDRVVGRGGHGVVFKGNLDLNVVAIKKSKIVVQREINEFINEVVVLSQVNHRNVVKLFGCCLETEVPLLIYEFISNGTLYHHLHVEGPISLSWVDRLRIALEVSRALSYLHSATSMPIVHRDIKTSNILLDDSLVAKVSDFGASRYITIDQTGVSTVVQGTIGYLDPMYYNTGRLTDKSDVFSFGVVLVELLTRKKPFFYRTDNGESLVSHFTSLLIEDKLDDIIDPQVIKEEDGEILEVARLAALCTELRGEDRPPMRQVELTLENLHFKRKKQVSANTTLRRHGPNQTWKQYTSTEWVTNEASRQYTMEEEILLSAAYPR